MAGSAIRGRGTRHAANKSMGKEGSLEAPSSGKGLGLQRWKEAWKRKRGKKRQRQRDRQ